MTRYLSHGPAASREGCKTAAERGTRYEFVTKFLQFFIATQRRTAADVSTWADPTDSEGNAEDMDYQQPRPGCSHHQDTGDSHISQEGHECVDICSTADRLGLSDNQVTALVSATLKAGGADLDKFVISTSTRDGTGC
ncbi:hypothetical protein GWK47_033561 [Chionoecetes opilio]|uniref:Uncharacterized protein n=1 Tax=Chionoecetes opilio TaxID=41210 RepID=A0A8J5D3Y7_CHIOP|nr:hypothetical protein GWK47_033561 [Chionoecetes opilio]